MSKYRKKPVVVEAFQMMENDSRNNFHWPLWLKKAHRAGTVQYEAGTMTIKTLEGKHTVTWGDFIIQGVKGELHLYKPDVFKQTYDKVEES